ncbi:hypothetical protein M432DRAFT_544506, partial [Thermoascus aurantiacus ATCC 26904]
TRLGMFIWIKVIQIEYHQICHQPLQLYMDRESIVKHMRSLQQIFIFFYVYTAAV